MRRKYPAAAGSIYGMCAVGSGRGVEMGLSCGFSDAVKGRIAREDRAYLKERFLPALKRRRVAVCLSGDDRFMACGGASPLLEVGLSRWTHARCVKRVCLRTEGVVWSGRCSALLEQTRKTGGGCEVFRRCGMDIPNAIRMDFRHTNGVSRALCGRNDRKVAFFLGGGTGRQFHGRQLIYS